MYPRQSTIPWNNCGYDFLILALIVTLLFASSFFIALTRFTSPSLSQSGPPRNVGLHSSRMTSMYVDIRRFLYCTDTRDTLRLGIGVPLYDVITVRLFSSFGAGLMR